jgi:hypothetical protein
MNSNRQPDKTGHIFRKNGFSLCWGESQWDLTGDGWFYPGITRPQSVGLDDNGLLCFYCAEKVRKVLKPQVSA